MSSYTQEQVEQILGIAAHEVSSPLSSLKLAIEMIVKTCHCPDTRHIEMARKAIRRTDILVKELLDASYMAAGGVVYHMLPLDFEEVAQNVVQELSYHVDQSCEIRLHIKDKALHVHADQTKLEQVLTNLIVNACKYAPRKPIDVVLSRTDGHVQCEVQDHGEGISADKLDVIFEKFERDISNKVQVGGLGLGLWICREIVNKHGGRIFARNVDNNGAVFVMQLPLLKD